MFDHMTEEILQRYLIDHKEDININYIKPIEGELRNESYDSEVV